MKPVSRDGPAVEGDQLAAAGERDVERAQVRPAEVDAAAIDLVRAHLAEVGEVEAAGGVEDDVVRPLERNAVDAIEQALDTTRGEVDTLDAAAGIVVGLVRRPHRAVGRMNEMK